MAQKHKIRLVPIDDPPNASSSSSSDEEEQVSSEEEVSSDNDKEQSLSPAPKTRAETESESESESDTVPAKVKPLASKPKAQAQKPKAQPSPTPLKSASKRPAAESANGTTDSKRAKKKSSTASASDEKTKDDEKKTPRRWSEDAELAILKGMLDFTSKTKHDPLKTNEFHDFMTKLPDWEEVSRDQLKTKVRSLKRKFDTVTAREDNGESPSFSKPHDQKVYELSMKVWGAKPDEVVEKPNSNGSVAKSPKKKETGKITASAKKPKPENKRDTKSEVVPAVNKHEKMDIDHNKVDSGSVGFLSRELSRYKEAVQLDEDEVKRGLELIGESKRAELERKWKEMRFAEIKLLSKRTLLIAEQTKLMIDALKSSDDYDS